MAKLPVDCLPEAEVTLAIKSVVNWQGLGLYLGLKPELLEFIAQNYTPELQKQMMVIKWLQSDVEATWEELWRKLTWTQWLQMPERDSWLPELWSLMTQLVWKPKIMVQVAILVITWARVPLGRQAFGLYITTVPISRGCHNIVACTSTHDRGQDLDPSNFRAWPLDRTETWFSLDPWLFSIIHPSSTWRGFNCF